MSAFNPLHRQGISPQLFILSTHNVSDSYLSNSSTSELPPAVRRVLLAAAYRLVCAEAD
jgi:hypothetical protein